jgi:hypothetical protein
MISIWEISYKAIIELYRIYDDFAFLSIVWLSRRVCFLFYTKLRRWIYFETMLFWIRKKTSFPWENKTMKKYSTFNGYSTAMYSISAEIIPTKKTIRTWNCISCILVTYLLSSFLLNDCEINKTCANILHILPSMDIGLRYM